MNWVPHWQHPGPPWMLSYSNPSWNISAWFYGLTRNNFRCFRCYLGATGSAKCKGIGKIITAGQKRINSYPKALLFSLFIFPDRQKKGLLQSRTKIRQKTREMFTKGIALFQATPLQTNHIPIALLAGPIYHNPQNHSLWVILDNSFYLNSLYFIECLFWLKIATKISVLSYNSMIFQDCNPMKVSDNSS
jgi:hypothetical protein